MNFSALVLLVVAVAAPLVHARNKPPRLFQVVVSVDNLAPNRGTCLTPVWVGIHNGVFDIYNQGEAASTPLERMAEDGNAAPLSAAFTSTIGSIVDGVVGDGPICPGESASLSLTVNVPRGVFWYFSYAAMVLPSNDAFIANGDPVAHSIFNNVRSHTPRSFPFNVTGAEVLDAGTEVNDEVAENTAFFGQSSPNTGEDEEGVVAFHGGFIEDGPILSNADYLRADFTSPRYNVMQVRVRAPKAKTIINTIMDEPNADGLTRARGVGRLRYFPNDEIEYRLRLKQVRTPLVALELYLGEFGVDEQLVFSFVEDADTFKESGNSRSLFYRGRIAPDEIDVASTTIWNGALTGGAFYKATFAEPEGAVIIGVIEVP